MTGTTERRPGLSIADVALAPGVSAHTLRHYARGGLMGGVQRASSRHRRDDDDFRWFEHLRRLRANGMPIRHVPRYAQLVAAGEGNEAERFTLLIAHRDRVRAQFAAAAGHREFIEPKIAIYGGRTA